MSKGECRPASPLLCKGTSKAIKCLKLYRRAPLVIEGTVADMRDLVLGQIEDFGDVVRHIHDSALLLGANVVRLPDLREEELKSVIGQCRESRQVKQAELLMPSASSIEV